MQLQGRHSMDSLDQVAKHDRSIGGALAVPPYINDNYNYNTYSAKVQERALLSTACLG